MNTQAISAAMKYPGCVERLRKEGKTSIARMAELLESPRAIDKALGYEGAASHWLSGRNGVSSAAEHAAAMWLSINDAPEPETQTGTMLLVVTNQPDKVRRVLAMLGAEVEDV